VESSKAGDNTRDAGSGVVLHSNSSKYPMMHIQREIVSVFHLPAKYGQPIVKKIGTKQED
jgi:hypothetical protein